MNYPLSLSLVDVGSPLKKSIGLSHLGYSADDPDGKAVTLTFTVKADVPVEKSTDPIRVIGFEPESIDVSLMLDVNEENRLRSRMQLPKKISTNASLPFQMKWNDVGGKVMYKWLTQDKGLKIFMKGRVKVELNVRRSEGISVDCIKAWWNQLESVGATDLIVIDPFLLTAEIIKGKCFESIILGERYSLVSESYQMIFSKKISPAGRVVKLTLSEIISAGATIESDLISSEIEIPAIISFGPGKFLSDNPSYVKDLSGSSVGLDGLKNSD